MAQCALGIDPDAAETTRFKEQGGLTVVPDAVGAEYDGTPQGAIRTAIERAMAHAVTA